MAGIHHSRVVEIAQLAMLIIGWFLLPGSVIRWTGIVMVAIAFPWLFSLTVSLLRPPRDQSWLAYYLAVGRDMITNAQQFLLALVRLGGPDRPTAPSENAAG